MLLPELCPPLVQTSGSCCDATYVAWQVDASRAYAAATSITIPLCCTTGERQVPYQTKPGKLAVHGLSHFCRLRNQGGRAGRCNKLSTLFQGTDSHQKLVHSQIRLYTGLHCCLLFLQHHCMSYMKPVGVLQVVRS